MLSTVLTFRIHSLLNLFSFPLPLQKSTYFWAPEKQFCIPCGCNPVGSMSLNCDVSGRCICKSGFAGKRCELSRQVYIRKRKPSNSQQTKAPHQRWGSPTASGCPRGAFKASAVVIKHDAFRMHCILACVCAGKYYVNNLSKTLKRKWMSCHLSKQGWENYNDEIINFWEQSLHPNA